MLLASGDIKPDEAEAWAKDNGLPPFASEPDQEQFHPMDESDWTPAMTVAWVAWRTPKAVREYWDEYRNACTDFIPSDYLLPPEPGEEYGRRKIGWRVDKRGHKSTQNILDDRADIVKQIRKKLRTTSLEATGIPSFGRNRIAIPHCEWIDLSQWGFSNAPDSIGADRGGPQYNRVRFPSRVVESFWPDEGSIVEVSFGEKRRKSS